MADRDTPPGDELVLNPNGTIRICIAGKCATWRCPTAGVFRKAYEGLYALDEDRDHFAAQIDEEARAAYLEHEGKLLPDDVEPELSSSHRMRIHLAALDRRGEWAIDLWRSVCAKEPPALGDLPPWMETVTFANEVLNHWQTIPKAASSSR